MYTHVCLRERGRERECFRVIAVCQMEMSDFMRTHSDMFPFSRLSYLHPVCLYPPPSSITSHSYYLSLSGVVSLRLGLLPSVGKTKRAARRRGNNQERGGRGGEEGAEGGRQVVPDQREEGNSQRKRRLVPFEVGMVDFY